MPDTKSEQQQLWLLRKLAADGFGELDQGRGLTISTERELRTIIAMIGRRGTEASKQRPSK